jgi:hypothetical protein
MSAATGATPQEPRQGIFSWIASLFTIKREGFHPVLALVGVAIFLLPLLALKAVGREDLWFTFSFALLVTMISDIVAIVAQDAYATRVRWSTAIVLVGACLTALGYLLGGANWILVALAVFATTLLYVLITAYGRTAAVASVLLNVWFLCALSISHALDKSPAQTWPLAGPQTLAWVGGGALWMLTAGALALAPRTRSQSQAQAQQGQSTSPGTRPADAASTAAPAVTQISRSLVTYAALAALAVSLAAAFAWGFDVPNADWMAIGALVAMRPSLRASAYRAGQRVAGALVGAILSAILLSVIHDRTALEIIIVILAALAGTLHEANYALHYAALSTVVLMALGLAHGVNLAENWLRVAWAFAGVLIALAVMLLADAVTSTNAHTHPSEPPRATTA